MTEEKLVHNYNVEADLRYALPEKVVFWDETLRDGEQTPGVFFTLEEKVELAKMMDDIGIDLIDCGIPAVSQKELESVKAIAAEGLRHSKVLAACRTLKSDIDACIKADADEITPFIAASPVHLKYKLKMTEEQVIEKSVESIEYGKDHGFKVTFVTEDTVRADLDFVERLYKAALDAGADRVLLCDTVGVMTPHSFKWWIREVKGRLPKNIEYGVHIHNDFGMATANSLAAVEEGIQVVNCCVNGLGERSGNTPFEEFALALELLYQKKTGLKLDRIYELSKRVEELSGVPIGITKPVVGYNAFTHESGIHTDGVIKHTATYEPIQVELIKRQRRFVFGKHTGAGAIEARLKDHAVAATPEQVKAIMNEIKTFTERRTKKEIRAFIDSYRDWDENHKGVTSKEFWAIVEKAGVKVPSAAKATAKATH